MIKRLGIALVLLSMVLHSASRLGMLSYLYQQRHQIAYAVGMITEVPIAMCNSDYDFEGGLQFHTTDDSDRTLPPAVLQAKEINLFFVVNLDLKPNAEKIVLRSLSRFDVREVPYSSPPLSIFHPPS